MKTETVYGIQKVGYDTPTLMLSKDEYENIIKALEFVELVYSLTSEKISVKDETSGNLTELTIKHLIRIY